jgi:hypothetical protein
MIALLGGECASSFRSGSTDDRIREKSDERVGGGRAEKPPRTRDVARRAINGRWGRRGFLRWPAAS